MARAEEIARLRAAVESLPAPNDVGAFAEYARDPVRFVVEVLRYQPWSRQVDFLNAIATWDRLAVKSGHAVSKSTTIVSGALWFAATNPGARAVALYPVYKQAKATFQYELKRLAPPVVSVLGGEIFDSPENGVQLGNGSQIMAMSSDMGEAIAGIRAPRMMVLVDEASGIDPDLFPAIRSLVAGGGKLILCGNPTRTVGQFFDCFNGRGQSSGWHLMTISSLESPNITGEREIPGLATQQYVDEVAAEFGAESAVYQCRILGEFPREAPNAVVTMALVEEAAHRWRAIGGEKALETSTQPLVAGLDCARQGTDESVLVFRRGNVVATPIAWRGLDGPQLAAQVVDVLTKLARMGERPAVAVDVVGVGASAYDALARYSEIECRPVNVSESAPTATHYRLRDAVWFAARDFLKAGGTLPPDTRLHTELLAPGFAFTPNGAIKVDGKDQLRPRLGGRSCDRADAFCLCVYEPPAAFKCGSFTSDFMDY